MIMNEMKIPNDKMRQLERLIFFKINSHRDANTGVGLGFAKI